MKYLNNMCFKTLSFTSLSMVIGSSKTWADLPLPMVNSISRSFDAMSGTREFLITSDSILFVGFLLWIAYVVFFFPKDTFKKL